MLRGYCCFSEGQFCAEVITKWLYPDTKCSFELQRRYQTFFTLFSMTKYNIRSKTVLDFLCNVNFICSPRSLLELPLLYI